MTRAGRPAHRADHGAVLAGLGYGLIIGPKAETRLELREYSLRSADR
jgi:hypothetical protein